MVGEVAGLWGLFGGFAVEGLELHAAWQRDRRWPWHRAPQLDAKTAAGAAQDSIEAGAMGYAVAEIVRLLIGAGPEGAAWRTT